MKIVAITLGLLLAGCGEEGGDQSAQDVQKGLGGIAKSMGEGLSAASKAFSKTASKQLEAHKDKITDLKKTAKSKTDSELKKLIEKLQTTLNKAQNKLSEMQSANEGSAKALQGELGSLMSQLSALYKKALDRANAL